MKEIIWRDPPPADPWRVGRPRGTGRYADYINALKDSPGRWAYFGPGNVQSAWQISKSYDVEYTTRKRDDGKVDIYLRANREG